MDNFAREIDRELRRRGPGLLRQGVSVFLALSLLLPGPAAHAAEFEIAADSFTVVNQVNISSATYFQTRAIAPPDPALATQLLTPGGLYFDATYYNVWDRTALAWVKLATGTVEAGRVAKSGDFMSGQLTTASTITVSGNAFSVGGSSFTVSGGSATVAYQLTAGSFVGNGAGLTNISAAPPANMATTDTAQTITGAKTLTQALVLPADPTAALQAATKQYVDSWSRPCVNPGDATDIMVAVGDLCVDKYEASVWSAAVAGTQYAVYPAATNFPCGNGLTGSGQTCAAAGTSIYARSVSGVTPNTGMTWFQANIACANAGKHLLTNAEWQAAAAGTPDGAPNCKVDNVPAAPSVTGVNTGCVSSYGVENMTGSVWEWVAEWGQYGEHYVGAVTSPNGDWTEGAYTAAAWPSASYGADGTWNVAGRSDNGAAWTTGTPAAVFRGGYWGNGASGGVFAFIANNGPSSWNDTVGFRCGRRR